MFSNYKTIRMFVVLPSSRFQARQRLFNQSGIHVFHLLVVRLVWFSTTSCGCTRHLFWCLNELLTSQRMCTLNTIYYLGYPKYQLQRVTNTIVPDIVWIFGRGASSINMASVHGKKADRQPGMGTHSPSRPYWSWDFPYTLLVIAHDNFSLI